MVEGIGKAYSGRCEVLAGEVFARTGKLVSQRLNGELWIHRMLCDECGGQTDAFRGGISAALQFGQEGHEEGEEACCAGVGIYWHPGTMFLSKSEHFRLDGSVGWKRKDMAEGTIDMAAAVEGDRAEKGQIYQFVWPTP